MQTETVFPTKPLLRPDQVAATKDEISKLEAKLKHPAIEDKAEVGRQLRMVKRDFESQVPRPPETAEEEGRMAKRAKELLEQIVVGMPSQEEMRKAPPGAVEKHMQWEKKNKPRIMEWKHIMLRLTGGEDRDAANIEKHRPTASSLNMDTAFIPGKLFHMPDTRGPAVTFSDEQIAVLKQLSPEIAERLATLTNDQRKEVKDALGGIGLEAGAYKKPKNKGGRPRKKVEQTSAAHG